MLEKLILEVFAFILGIGLIAVTVFGVILLEAMWQVWFVKDLYLWFVIPLGAPELSLWHLVGLLLFINMVFKSSGKFHKDEDIDSGKMIMVAVLAPPIVWMIAGFVHHMMTAG